MTEPKAVAFSRFGGLRLDQAIDEVGPENAIYLRDVDWDGTTGKIRPRDGFQKLKAADASGPYKGLFAHSAARLLATKRVSSTSLKLVAIDREGAEKAETSLDKAVARSTFAHFGTPVASYTYMRTLAAEQKVVRFDGTAFSEPTATLNRNPDGTGGSSGKAMPKGAIMLAWPAGDNRFVVLNTGPTGGPGGAASSPSHGWFSDPGNAEAWHTDPETQAGEANYYIFGAGDGEEITDACAWGDYVFVFKETKFFVVFGISEDGEGRPEFDVRQVNLGEGVRMKPSIVEGLAESSDHLCCAAPDAVYFCTSDGVYATTGGAPGKVSQALRPLEEVSPFDGPMADFLNGAGEVCRWPAAGIVSLGRRLIVKRYEYLFVLDLPTGEWTCWKMPQVSLAVWTGLGSASAGSAKEGAPESKEDSSAVGGSSWSNIANLSVDNFENFATVSLTAFGAGAVSHYALGKALGLSLPEGAIVDGVALKLRKAPSVQAIVDYAVHLTLGGKVLTTENKAKPGTWPFGEVVYGGPTDLWGEGLIRSNVAESGFGFVIAAENKSGSPAQASLNGARVTVYYHIAGIDPSVRPRLLCTQSKSVFFTQPGASEDAGTRQAEWQPGFYDLGNQEEKTLEGSRIWGQGDVALAGYRDLEETADFEDDFNLGEGLGQDRGYSTQTAFLFSHRLKLAAGSSVQRVVRYLRETELAGGEGAP